MRNDNIFTYEFTEILYGVTSEFTIMRDHLQCEVCGACASRALTKPILIVNEQAFMEIAEHFFYLPVNSFKWRTFAELIKKYRIAFYFRYHQACIVGVDQHFQQFLDDEAAVLNVRLA